jgi:hypothetical protein
MDSVLSTSLDVGEVVEVGGDTEMVQAEIEVDVDRAE